MQQAMAIPETPMLKLVICRPMREVEQCALEAAPSAFEQGITVKELARKAGYALNFHFYESVRILIEAGLLVRVRNGVKRAKGTIHA